MGRVLDCDVGVTPIQIRARLGQDLGRISDRLGRIGQVAEDKVGHWWSVRDTPKPLKFQRFRLRGLGAGDGNRTRVLSLGS